MDLSHDHFDELAVAHVLGGLNAIQATEFRGHLLGCKDCRARVAELRALAKDLDAAAREERASRGDEDGGREPDDTSSTVRRRRGPGWLAAVGGLVVLVLGVLVVWNQALRFDNVTLAGVTANRESVLATLGDGTAVPVVTRAGVTGVAAHDRTDDVVAISLGNIGELADMNHVVVWRGDGSSSQPTWTEYVSLTPEQLPGQRLGLVVPVTASTSSVIVTVEQSVMPEVPNGNPVFTATLTP